MEWGVVSRAVTLGCWLVPVALLGGLGSVAFSGSGQVRVSRGRGSLLWLAVRNRSLFSWAVMGGLGTRWAMGCG